MAESALAKTLEDRYGALKGVRDGWDTLWRDIAKYVIPRRVPGLNGTVQSPGVDNEALLFDTTAVFANQTLASGVMAWMCPLDSPWFAYEPMRGKDDAAKMWFNNATRAATEELAVSSFYTAVHEYYLDLCAFGTACLYVEPGRRNNLSAQVWPVGTFVVDEDETGQVDTVMREFELTARQAVQKFGEENVSKEVRKQAEAGGSKALEKSKYLHAIYPREDKDRDTKKMDDRNMAIASVYLDRNACHVCKESGYPEMPVMVSRFLQWGSGMGCPYGWSPGFSALPEARQLNFLQKMLDALAEKMAFPPVLSPEELEGEIDPNAMGVTYFSKDLAGNLPKEWMTAGRYDIGLQRVEMRQKAINDAFFVDLFKMFAQLDKQMTAREVAERAAEKVSLVSPMISRQITELFNPLHERVFGIMLRLGKFGPVEEIPQSIVQVVGDGMAFLPPPKVQYLSRIALALRSLPSLGYNRTLERLGVVAQVMPSVLDNFDFDTAERTTALSDGVPTEFLHDEKDVQATRKARAEAQAAAQKQQEMMMAAEAASKVGGIPADTPVGKVVDSQIQRLA